MTTTPESAPSTAPELEHATAEAETISNPGSRWRLAGVSLSLSVGIVAVDQYTKWLTLKNLSTPDPLGFYPATTVIPNFLRFIYAENRGAAFSILYGHVELLALVSVIAIGILIYFFRSLNPSETWGRLALGMILGGAIGNLYDRVFRGFVVDMIDAYVGEHHWPTFNVADSFICIGMTILVVRMLRGKV